MPQQRGRVTRVVCSIVGMLLLSACQAPLGRYEQAAYDAERFATASNRITAAANAVRPCTAVRPAQRTHYTRIETDFRQENGQLSLEQRLRQRVYSRC